MTQKVRAYFINLFRIIFPTNWKEACVFVFFLIVYSFFAFDLANHYTIIYNDTISWNIYHNFDNSFIVLIGGDILRHPFSKYLIFFYLIKVAPLISGGEYNEVFRLVYGIASSLAISLGLLSIFKYLQNVIRLSFGVSVLLVLFTGIFGTSIILSFTPETFTYSFFALALYCYYSAYKIKKTEPLSFFDLFFFSGIIGGITITNLVKVYVPLMFEKTSFSIKHIAKRALAPLFLFIIILIVRIHLISPDLSFVNFIHNNLEAYNFHSKIGIPIHTNTSNVQLIIDNFFGANVLIPNYRIIDTIMNGEKYFTYKSIFVDTYENRFCYIFLLLFFGLILWSIIKNRKNRWVLLLASMYLVDILIHCILKFGIEDLSVYGGHFVFIYPLLLGWLLHSYRNSKKIYTSLIVILVLLMVFLGYNNFLRMQDFYDFINTYYRV